MKREEFLARVREALHRREVDPIPAPPTLVVPAGETLSGDLVDAFLAQATAGGTVAERVANVGAARDAIARVARNIGAASFLASEDAVAKEASSELEIPRAPRPEDADLGITGARCAIARTGTVVLGAEGGRLAGLLPMHHVMLVDREDVVAGLSEAYARYAGSGADLPSAWVQITGPSRTADIEMTLTTGVHGPGYVYVLVIG